VLTLAQPLKVTEISTHAQLLWKQKVLSDIPHPTRAASPWSGGGRGGVDEIQPEGTYRRVLSTRRGVQTAIQNDFGFGTTGNTLFHEADASMVVAMTVAKDVQENLKVSASAITTISAALNDERLENAPAPARAELLVHVAASLRDMAVALGKTAQLFEKLAEEGGD
jgi:hypothetical protein